MIGSALWRLRWFWALPFVAAVVVVLLGFVAPWFRVDSEEWAHVLEHALLRVSSTTLLLTVLTATFAGVLGFASALVLLSTRGRLRWMFWAAFFLPLALPTYVLAFAWLQLLEPSGYLYHLWAPHGFVMSARNVTMLSAVLASALYPYVTIALWASLRVRWASWTRQAQSLGLSWGSMVWRVVLPAAKMPLAVGLVLVIFEVLSEFGATQLFSVETIGTYVFRIWFGMQNSALAVQLVSCVGLFVFLSWFLWSRVGPQNASSKSNEESQEIADQLLPVSSTLNRVCVNSIGGGIAVLSVLPWLVLFTLVLNGFVRGALGNLNFSGWLPTLGFSLLATASVGLLFVIYTSLVESRSMFAKGLVQFFRQSWIFYAVPGVFIAVAALEAMSWIESAALAAPGVTIFVWLLVILIKYMRVALAPSVQAQQWIPRSWFESAELMACSSLQRWRSLEWPKLRIPLALGLIAFFVDVAKELPIAMMFRPMNVQLVAIQMYEWSSEGRWVEASVYGLMLGVMGLVPVALVAAWQVFSSQAKVQGVA